MVTRLRRVDGRERPAAGGPDPEGSRHGQQAITGCPSRSMPPAPSGPRAAAVRGPGAAVFGGVAALGEGAGAVPLVFGGQLHVDRAAVPRARDRARAGRRIPHLAQARPLSSQEREGVGVLAPVTVKQRDEHGKETASGACSSRPRSCSSSRRPSRLLGSSRWARAARAADRRLACAPDRADGALRILAGLRRLVRVDRRVGGRLVRPQEQADRRGCRRAREARLRTSSMSARARVGIDYRSYSRAQVR